jgi:hypothetical protein
LINEEVRIVKGLNFKLGALGILALVTDYAAVALLVGLLLLERHLHFHRGTDLDILLMLIVAFGTLVWLAGFRLNRILARDKSLKE